MRSERKITLECLHSTLRRRRHIRRAASTFQTLTIMKKTHLILLFLTFTLLFSCQKDKKPRLGYCSDLVPYNQEIFDPGPQEFGWAKGVKGGFPWEASAMWRPREEDSLHWSLHITTYEGGYVRRESIVLGEIPYEKGKYKVSGYDNWDGIVDGGYARLIEDGDAVLSYFSTNDTKESWLIITEIDPENKLMKGLFELHFGPEDCLDFQVDIFEGSFEARMWE